MYGVIGVRRPLPEIDKPRVHKKKRARYYGVHSFIIKKIQLHTKWALDLLLKASKPFEISKERERYMER